MASRQFTIVEHKSLYISQSGEVHSDGNDNLGIPSKSFNDIASYVTSNGRDATQFLIPGYSRTLGHTLKAKQFVGVIETKSGISIEILPKIANNDTGDGDTRAIFLKMLKTLKNSPFKHFNVASLNSKKMHILEIFITMFCEELSVLVKKGIKSDYIAKSDNSRFLKGRLKIAEHLRKNVIHKERFYVEFDEYQVNRMENRIIKTTLDLLYEKSRNNGNKKRLREFLFIFDDVVPITDRSTAFSNIKLNRQMRDYAVVLEWCKIFLSSESVTPFKGSTVAFALLFDMNRIFEDYVAACLRRNNPDDDIKTQVGTKYLSENPKKFKLKPDIMIGESIIADTKWKLLESSCRHNGISQSDIYQMYAYGKKYDVREIHLIYPYTPDFPEIAKTTYKFDAETTLKIKAFDCKQGVYHDDIPPTAP